MVIMGVDPGSRVTGYGIVSVEGNHFRCLDYGAISVVVNGAAPMIPERLKTIHSALTELMAKFEPEIVVVEGLFYAVNVKSALTLGHARGVILLAAAEQGLPVAEYSPLEVKKAVTGYGRADKQQVQTMVKTLLNLKSEPEPHDASDALALALCQAFNGKGLKHRQGRWRSYTPKGNR
ncbi:MAG TPA: crossover junction endodeoxyribonuclease RuvC [Acidobacteriota bacterium]|nr:crossover junction endodeoxyribonuclease RuvC [Acidobacteriota bacterium]